MRLAILAGCALGLASGWNVSNTGAVAAELSHRYGVGLTTIGLFTTALFLTHLAMQVPGGKTSDAFGGRRTGLLGLAIVIAANAALLVTPDAALALVMRAVAGVGTGFAFVSGAAYVRGVGGSPFAQGLYGGVGLAGGGVALAVVPQVENWLGWRAPFVTALAVSAAALVLLGAARPDERPARPPREEGLRAGVFRDRRLYRLAALYGASLGLSVVIGNWVVTLLDRHGGVGKGTAGAIGALTLGLGVVTRPLGGWILREHPARARAAVAASLAAGCLGTALLAVARPPELAALGAALIGLGAGIPFAPAFTGAALVRPDAPAAAVGFVNGASSAVVVAGTPLLGLAFSLPGDGRLGFAIVAALWAASLLVLPSDRDLAAVSEVR